MELTVNVKLGGLSTARKAAEVANRMGGYRAQVLLRRGDVTVNAKSLMGLLSLGLEAQSGMVLLAEGPDEAEAVAAIEQLLSQGAEA